MTDRLTRFELLLLFLALALGVVLRVQGVGEYAFFGDEHHTLLLHRPASPPVDLGEASYGEILATYDQTGSHVVLPLLQRIALDLVGPGPLSYRLPALLPGLLMLLLCFPLLRSFLGARPALIGTLALAVSPMHVFYSRYGRSYALVMLTSVLLAYCVLQALRTWRSHDAHQKRWWVAVFFLAWFTPYAHLSTAGYVFALGLVAIGSARAFGGTWKASLVPLATFASAAIVCAAVFLPLYEQVIDYMNVQQVKVQPKTVIGIPILLYGGSAIALLGALSLCVVCVQLWRSDPAALVIAMTTLVGPLIALIATRPHGMEYAYARYLLCSMPFLLGFIGFAIHRLCRRFLGEGKRADFVALGIATIVFGIPYLRGPIGPGAPVGPYGNGYLAMHTLPAFNEPYPDVPEFYREIAADEGARRVIEFPPIYTRAALCYRNYALFHGKDVTIAFDGPMPSGMRGGPYARLSQIDVGPGDYLVLHREPVPEVRRYFRWVYDEAVPRSRHFGDAGFLERHSGIFVSSLPPREMLDRVAAAIRNKYGPAWRKNDRMLVWKFGE